MTRRRGWCIGRRIAFLPPSTNPAYTGSPVAAHVLAVLAILTIVPGCIHVFLPDGGAGTIAGIDLGACGPTVVALFAWAGATQIVFGLVMLAVAVRYRSFVPAVLTLVLLERSLHAAGAWAGKGSAAGHHPPEHYAVLVVLPLLVLLLYASLRSPRRR